MTAAKTIKAFVTQAFRDSGTRRSFSPSTPGDKDSMPDIEAGAFANYAAADLVRELTPDDLKASKAAA